MAVLRTMRKNKENESKIHKIERTFDSLSFIVYFLYQADNLFYRLETVLIQVIVNSIDHFYRYSRIDKVCRTDLYGRGSGQ